jgi:hypothetical protein
MSNKTSNYSLDVVIGLQNSILDRIIIFLSVFGFSLSSLSLVVFLDFKEKLFIYLKIEQIWIMLGSLISSFNLVFWINSQFEHTILWPIFFKFFLVYFTSTCELCAFICTIYSAVIFLSMIDKKWDLYMFKLSPYITIFIVSVLSLALFSFQLFEFDIKFDSSKFFVVKNVENFDTITFKVTELTAFAIRDGIFLILLLVLNCFLYKKLRICLEKKRKMVKYSQPTRTLRNTETNNSNPENEQTTRRTGNKTQTDKGYKSINKMILCCCLNSTFERIPILLAFIYKNLNQNDSKTYLLVIGIGTLSLKTAYILKFFIYFYFNKRFRIRFINIFFKNRFAKIIWDKVSYLYTILFKSI